MRRSKERWTKEDDSRLCRALLGVYTDEVDVDLSSSNRAAWTRVHQRYQQLVALDTAKNSDQGGRSTAQRAPVVSRSAGSLHTRWAVDVGPDVAHFASLVAQVRLADCGRGDLFSVGNTNDCVCQLTRDGRSGHGVFQEANKRFAATRKEANTATLRQFLRNHQQAAAGDEAGEATRPRLKFQSFHFLHCYDILRSYNKLLQAIPVQESESTEEETRKRRQTTGASGSNEAAIYLSAGDSSSESEAEAEKEENAPSIVVSTVVTRSSKRKTGAADGGGKEIQLPGRRRQKIGSVSESSTIKYIATSPKSVEAEGKQDELSVGATAMTPRSDQRKASTSDEGCGDIQQDAQTTGQESDHGADLLSSFLPGHTAECDSVNVLMPISSGSSGVAPSRLRCDEKLASDYIRLKMQTLKEDRRLKLLAELRGIVETIGQLGQQLAWGGVTSVAVAARTGRGLPTLEAEVIQDLAFFRDQKNRLKRQLAELEEAAGSGGGSSSAGSRVGSGK
ncbi:hypothetical protein BBJ28_00010140 [Nothophytophthora sp. Chile5]|nr:hypothetical protein BBJ28_00010140 [Nothophytophthora sp. Chile5]